jgi:hypothetical protein
VKKIRLTIDLDTESGDYEIQYNNISEPGKPLDFSKIMLYLRGLFSKHEKDVLKEADSGKSKRTSRDTDEMN